MAVLGAKKAKAKRHHVSVRVTQKQMAALKAAAERAGLGLSEYIRKRLGLPR